MSINTAGVQGQRPVDPLMSGEDAAEAEAEPKPAHPPFNLRSELWTMFAMGWPMVASFLCRLLMASTDTAFVGHLDNSTIGWQLQKPYSAESYLAAGALTDMVVSILTVPPLAFNQVLNALVGQALGSGNKKMAGTWLQLSIFFLAISYVPFLAIQYFYTGELLHLLGFDDNVRELGNLFAKVSIVWPIPNGIYQCMRFYFQAQGISRPAMYNNIAFVFINGLFNWIFVFGGPFQYEWCPLRWHGVGFVGAALSISASRCLQPFTYWLYMFVWKRHHRETWPGMNLDFLEIGRVKRFLSQALPYVGTLIFQSVSGQVTTLLIAQLGAVAIAASSAVQAAAQVASQGTAVALTAVGAVRVGYYLGAGDAHGAKMAMWIVLATSLITGLITLFVVWPLSDPIIGLVTDDDTVKPVAEALVAATFVQCVVGAIVQVLTSGVLGGQGRTLVITLISFGFELPTSIGGVAIMVLVLKWRMPDGLLNITWVNAAIGAFEMFIVGVVVLCGDWEKYAREALQRQEAARAENAANEAAAAAPSAVEPLQAVVPADADEQAPPP